MCVQLDVKYDLCQLSFIIAIWMWKKSFFFSFLTSGYFMSILTICWLENRKFFLSGILRVRLAIFQVALGCVIMKYIYESTMKLEFSFVVIWVERSVTFMPTEPLTRFGIEIMKLKSTCELHCSCKHKRRNHYQRYNI